MTLAHLDRLQVPESASTITLPGANIMAIGSTALK